MSKQGDVYLIQAGGNWLVRGGRLGRRGGTGVVVPVAGLIVFPAACWVLIGVFVWWGEGGRRAPVPRPNACQRVVASPGTGPTHPYYPVKSGCEPTWASFRT